MAMKVPAVFTAIDKFSAPLKKMEKSTVGFSDKINSSIARTNRAVDSLTPSLGSVGDQVLGLAGIAGGLALGNKMIEIQQATEKARLAVSQLTDLTGSALDSSTAKVSAIASQFDKDFNEVLISTNTLSKQMGLSFNDSLEMIKNGFIVGADNSDELLNIIKEYPAFMKEAGLSANTFFNVIDKQVKNGIYSDKGVDAIKEANLRLREMPKSTIDALDGIGLSSANLMKGLEDGSLSTFDVMQKVSGKLAELPANSTKVGTAIADIFGGPGEDAGLQFLTTLKDIDQKGGSLADKFSKTEKTQNNLFAANQKLQLSYNKLFGDTNSGFMELKANAVGFIADALLKIAPVVNNIIRITSKWLSGNGGMILTLVGVFISYVAVLKTIKVVMALVRAATVAYNVVLGIKNALQGKSLLLSRRSAIALKAHVVATKAVTVATKAFNLVLRMNPIGLVVTAVVLLGVAIYKMIQKWESWGRVVAVLMGPLGWVIFAIKEIYDNWDRVTSAFESGGIMGALVAIKDILFEGLIKAFDSMPEKMKVIGASILKWMIKPIEWILQMANKLGVGGGALASLRGFQASNQEVIDRNSDSIGKQSPVNLQATQSKGEVDRYEEITRGQLDINVNGDRNTSIDTSKLGPIPVRTAQTFNFD